MAELTFCATCYALTQPEDAKAHAADHAHTKSRLDALTRNNTGYLQQVAELKQQIAAYGRQLDAHPISMDPETIEISAAPEYDPADLTDDEDELADDQDAEPETAQEAAQTFVDEYPLAIDRPDEDDLDARIAHHTGTAPTI